MTPDQFTRTNLRANLRQRGYSEPQIVGAVDAAMAHKRVTNFGALVIIACRHAGQPLGRHQPFLSTTTPSAPQSFAQAPEPSNSATRADWSIDPLWRRCQLLALSDSHALSDWLASITPANLAFLSRLVPLAESEPQGHPAWQAAIISRPLIAQVLASRVAQP